MKTLTETPDAEAIRARVREGYGKIAVSDRSCGGAGPTCCGSAPATAATIAQQIGYAPAELAALPACRGPRCGCARTI